MKFSQVDAEHQRHTNTSLSAAVAAASAVAVGDVTSVLQSPHVNSMKKMKPLLSLKHLHVFGMHACMQERLFY